jgi:HD-GYP domain-containing protein (c-di-GMP phosphodiesterase class II)
MRAFAVDSIAVESTTDFDLYIAVEGMTVLFASAPYRWGAGELQRLRAAGHASLLYRTEDAEKVLVYEKIRTLPVIEMGLPPRERLVQITSVASELTRVLWEHPISEGLVAQAKYVADQMVATVTEDPTSVTALSKLAHHDYYTYFHSSRVAAYAIALAIQMSARDPVQLRELAYGCFLHDVGKNRVELSVLNKQGPLLPDEMDLLRRHPLFGFDQIKPAGVSTVGLEIIVHHHERLDAKGYPHGIGKNELLDEVRIAAFADVFDALTTNRPYQQSRTRFEALDLIRFKLLDGLSTDVFKAMVELLDGDRNAIRPELAAPVKGG